MPPHRLPVAATLAAILIVGMAVTGCGRRGGLEAPPSAAVLSTDEEGNVVEQQDAADRPFILDSLIQ